MCVYKKIDVYGFNIKTQQREYLYSTNRFKLCREAVAQAVECGRKRQSLNVAGGCELRMWEFSKFTARFSV